MVLLDEYSEPKTRPYRTEVAVGRERHGESNTEWKSCSWLGISLKQHWDMLSSGSRGRMSKIMSQTKSRHTSALQSLQLLQHPQIYLKHKTWAENELLEDVIFFPPPFFFPFYHLNARRRYSLCIKWCPKKKMTEPGINTLGFTQPVHIQWQETLPGCYMRSWNGL